MQESLSRYYRLPLFGNLEALSATLHNTSFPPHYHDTYNITLIDQGSFPSQVNNKEITAPAGSILITNPNEIHANPFEKQNRVSFFTFYLAPDFITHCNAGQPVIFNNKVVYDAPLFTQLRELSLNIIRGRVPHSGNPFLKTFNRLVTGYGSAGATEENGKANRLFEELLATENFSKFSLQDAARRFGMDKYKFLRLFKYQTGLTPNNYFILKRIEKSKSLLSGSSDLLSVAIELGFYDAAHFSNHFRKFTGISPGTYIQAL